MTRENEQVTREKEQETSRKPPWRLTSEKEHVMNLPERKSRFVTDYRDHAAVAASCTYVHDTETGEGLHWWYSSRHRGNTESWEGGLIVHVVNDCFIDITAIEPAPERRSNCRIT